MNLILSACSIKSRFLYSVYRFCLGFPENRRQTACFAFILRKQPRLMGYSDLHFRQQTILCPAASENTFSTRKLQKGQWISRSVSAADCLRESDSLRDTSGESLRGAFAFLILRHRPVPAPFPP